MRKLMTPPKPSSGNDGHSDGEALAGGGPAGAVLTAKTQARQIEKGSATDVSEWPAEFRTLMQSYFEQAEGIR